jgi:hypothetical protein
VSLTVYDILGRQVAVLVNEKREAGVHEVKFSAKGGSLPAGRQAPPAETPQDWHRVSISTDCGLEISWSRRNSYF